MHFNLFSGHKTETNFEYCHTVGRCAIYDVCLLLNFLIHFIDRNEIYFYCDFVTPISILICIIKSTFLPSFRLFFTSKYWYWLNSLWWKKIYENVDICGYWFLLHENTHILMAKWYIVVPLRCKKKMKPKYKRQTVQRVCNTWFGLMITDHFLLWASNSA